MVISAKASSIIVTIHFYTQKQRKPLEIKGFLLYQYLSSFMVEARGIEPLSEGIPTKASTSIALIFDFAL